MKIRLTILWSLALLSASCVKIDLSRTDHPATARITLTTDWSHRTDGIAIPESYTARAGGYSATLTGTTNVFPNLVPPGMYHLQVFNTAEKIAVNGNTASATTLHTPSADGIATFVDAWPGWFFSAAADERLEQDTDYDITVAMVQQVRLLTIDFMLTGGDPSRIASVSATLGGVAQSIDIDTGAPTGAPAGVIPQFTRTGDRMTASVRLLGVTGGAQTLTVHLTFTDGTVDSQTIRSDLTAELAGFNSGKDVPVVLGATLETPVRAGFTGSITDWQVISGGSHVVN